VFDVEVVFGVGVEIGVGTELGVVVVVLFGVWT
jgi:hypothetical protein